MSNERGIIVPGIVGLILMVIFAIWFLVALASGNGEDASIAGSLLAINVVINAVIFFGRRLKGD